ncbi:hypothetical protein K491DRAFT_693710 [Lophiostoma macrostomum CBS 122681]|uniref:Uncharacterized protein n=1 Tax=Lophiostoma macrostomum CBS 122681 TaxID=1314788 RepID=A0A6A6T5H2_9PLEO|nr:hypothetical protein K491DRAFT_693710 [Lophiostoma macrostomum CBS 122681]
MYTSTLFFSLLSLLYPSQCLSTTRLPITNVTSIPNLAENIAVRSNSHLLITSVTTPSIYTLDPSFPNTTTAQFPPIPGANGLGGITELRPDLFVVAAGLWNTTARRAAHGSAALWYVDFRNSSSTNSTGPLITYLASIPNAIAVNGITTAPGSDSIVLLAESAAGLIYAVDTAAKPPLVKVAVKSEYFAPEDAEVNPASLGINGIKSWSCEGEGDEETVGYVYFTGSASRVFGRVGMGRGAVATGPVEILANLTGDGTGDPASRPDDFALDTKGRAWVSLPRSSIVLVQQQRSNTSTSSRNSYSDAGPSWSVQTVANRTDTLQDPTSVAVGRGRWKDRLFVTTFRAEVSAGVLTFVGTIVGVDAGSYMK